MECAALQDTPRVILSQSSAHKSAFDRLRPLLVRMIGFLFATTLRASDSLNVIASCPPVAPGGTAQITITLQAPVSITHGRFDIDVDPAVFGNISAVNVFSASGDQQGAVKLQGQHAEVVFGAESGGIGRLPNLPVAEITVPVLAGAPAGATGAVTIHAASPWREISGQKYTVLFDSPGVPIGAGMSIQSVTPGAGPLPAGTVVTINGQGFTKSTQLQLDGVGWSNLQFVSPARLTFTLNGPADLAGRAVVLNGANGLTTRYYSNLTPASVQDDSGNSGYWPIFPVAAYQYASGFDYYWLENDGADPVDVVFKPLLVTCTPCRGQPIPPDKNVTVPARGLYLVHYNFSGGFPARGAYFNASAPIRVLLGIPPSTAQLPDWVPMQLSPNLSSNPSMPNRFLCNPGSVDYRIGDPVPPPFKCVAVGPLQQVSVGTDDGNAWLQTVPSEGSSAEFSVSMDPRGLGVGSHVGVATALVASNPYYYTPPFESASLTLNIHKDATIASNFSGVSFVLPSPTPQNVVITSTSPSVPITVVASDPWFQVTPTSGTTPLTLTVSLALPVRGNETGTITVMGPGNALTLPVQIFRIHGLIYGNPDLTLTAKAGSTSVVTTTLSTSTRLNLTVSTDSSGNWLSADATPPAFPSNTGTLTIRADPSGLAPGLYHGTVQATPADPGSDLGNSEIVTVTFSVWSDPAPPAGVCLKTSGYMQTQYTSQAAYLLTVLTPIPLPFSVTFQPEDGMSIVANGDVGSLSFAANTPATVALSAITGFPGTYNGTVTVTTPSGSSNSVVEPVSVTRSSNPAVSPVRPNISAIVNAASLLPGAIAPGEIVSVFGLVSSFGTAGIAVGPDGTVNRSHYGVRVLFDGIAAPLTYESAAQINAVVPYEIAGRSMVTVQIDGGGVLSAPWSVPVALSAPGVFTQAGSGEGGGSILNQDLSLNTPQNPASRGSTIQIFVTGEGVTNPMGVTGEVTGSDTKSAVQKVLVEIGGVEATVVSATTATNAIAGLFQVTAIVPEGIPSGPIPVVVRIGTASSQPTATLSVD